MVASEILKITLSPGLHIDSLFWRYERNESFSVKSAYRFFRSLSVQGGEECSSVREEHKLWKFVWKMRVPDKVRIFALRVCREGLPSKQNLQKKRLDTSIHCDFCTAVVEYVAHAIFHCPAVRDTWLLNMPLFREVNETVCFSSYTVSVEQRGSGTV